MFIAFSNHSMSALGEVPRGNKIGLVQFKLLLWRKEAPFGANKSI